MRYVLLAILSLGLLACNQVSKSIGEGPRVVSERFAGQVSNLNRDLRFRNISIAIGRNTEHAAMHYCPALGDCVNDLDGSVVDRCNQDNRYDCALFMLDDKIVWRGPIFFLDRSTNQTIPYSGRWKLQYDWADLGKGEVELVAHFGELRTGNIPAAGGECKVMVFPTEFDRGTFRLSCPENLAADGRYLLSDERIATGAGTDSQRRQLTFRFPVDAGAGL